MNNLVVRYVWIGFVLYAVFLSVVALFFFERYETHFSLYNEHQLETATMELETLKEAYATTAKTTFEIAVNTQTVCSLMSAASSTQDPRQLNKIRKELYKELFSVYQELEENNLRQLHFHLPGSISFLRFHRPDKYGDSLKGIRLSIDAVNESKKEVHGFEEGRIFNGFRHVFPLFDGNRFVGTVELSYSFDAIKELASRLYPSQYDLILKKELIESTVFNEEQSNYSDSLFEGFVQDKTLKQEETIFSPETIKKIILKLTSEKKLDLDHRYNQLYEIEIDGNGYSVVFNALYSFDNEKVGYIIRYKSEDYFQLLKKDLWESLILGMIINLIVAVVISYFLYRLALQKEQLHKMATTDALTGIANRSTLEKTFKIWSNYAKRYDEMFCMIFFDVDHFKQINDRFGHNLGDEALKDLSRLVLENLRETDIFGRWGGEEFVIVLTKTSLHEAEKVAEKLRSMISQNEFQHGSMSCSFGVSQYDGSENIESLIARTDALLYEAKEKGRNRVVSS